MGIFNGVKNLFKTKEQKEREAKRAELNKREAEIIEEIEDMSADSLKEVEEMGIYEESSKVRSAVARRRAQIRDKNRKNSAVDSLHRKVENLESELADLKYKLSSGKGYKTQYGPHFSTYDGNKQSQLIEQIKRKERELESAKKDLANFEW